MGNRMCKDGWLKTYLELTKDMESPLLYHLWSGITVISAALDYGCYFDMRRFKVRPNLFVVLSGPTGVKKSSASRHAVNLFRKCRAAVDKTPIIEGKITGPKLHEDLGVSFVQTGQARAFIHAPEFKVFAESTMSNDPLLQDMVDYWDAPDVKDYKLRKGSITLENCYVTMLGCSTPEWLEHAGMRDFIESGFSARIIYVHEDKNNRRVHRPEKNPDEDRLVEALLHDLEEITKLRVVYDWDKEADEWHKKWYGDESWRKRFDNRMRGYVERRQAYIIKLTMILKASFGDDNVITLEDNLKALKLLETIEPNFSKVYDRIGGSSYARLVNRILDMLEDGPKTEGVILARLGKTRPKREIDEALMSLVTSGIIVAEPMTSGFGGGRKAIRYSLAKISEYDVGGLYGEEGGGVDSSVQQFVEGGVQDSRITDSEG